MKKYANAQLFIVPSLIGMAVFFFIPAVATLYHAFTNVRGGFVFFSNFADVFGSAAFRLAARNSLLFLAASLPLGICVPFALASAMQKVRRKQVFVVAFMLPLIVPSGSVVFFWNTLFADNGAVNSLLFQAGMQTTPWFSTNWSFAIVLMMFLFRNIGFNLVLYLAGYQLIDKEYYEVARIEGAGTFAIFRHVTFIYILPTTFLVFMMTIINSFRIFREIYLLFGRHPHQSIYMLQHFMSNNFAFANMQRLSVASTAISIAIMIIVVGIFFGQKKISDTFG